MGAQAPFFMYIRHPVHEMRSPSRRTAGRLADETNSPADFTHFTLRFGRFTAEENDAVPDITNNQVQIVTVSPTLAPQEVEQLITFPIIFTTAYDEYALQAFRVNSIAYLLKPIGSTDLQKAVDKLNLFGNIGTSSQPATDLQAVMRALKREESYKTHFLVPVKGDRFVPVGVEQISYFYIDGGAVKAVTLSGETFLFQQTLDELAEQLNPRQFFRANRQYIVAHKAVTGVSLWFGGRMVLQLTPPTDEKVLISKARVPAFREWF